MGRARRTAQGSSGRAVPTRYATRPQESTRSREPVKETWSYASPSKVHEEAAKAEPSMSSAPLSFRPPPPDSATFLPPSVPLRGPEAPWSRGPLPASPLRLMTDRGDGPIGSLPEHLLVEILTRLPTHEWVQISCVSKHWASLFRGEYLWQIAIARKWPSAGFRKRWPGPIPRGSARRRFQALHVSENLVPSGGEIDELVGHTYLYLKEQLERVAVPPSSILHGTIIDQFIACGRTGEKAHELASNIWIAVIDNFEENQQTFILLKHLAQEGDFFLPFPYSRSYKVLWRVFDKLFTDFCDCFSGADYHEALAGAKSRFQPVPSSWIGH